MHRKDLDEVNGFVLKTGVLLRAACGEGDTILSTLKRSVPVAPENIKLPRLFGILICDLPKISMVVNEYGVTKGLITLEDLVETLLGLENLDENDRVADMLELARQKWLERARSQECDGGAVIEGDIG